MMFLRMIAHTPLGAFTGNVNKEPLSETDVNELKNLLQSKKMTYLVIFEGKTEIVLQQNVLQNSVITMWVTE